jgi:DNA primase
MGRIPDHIIEQIKDAADIVDVIGKHVQLKRAGSEFKGLCPFHDERTPSFGVNPSKRAYYCFGCGSGGSVIRFLQDYHNLTFPEALKQLAGEYGIQIIEESPDPQAESRRKLQAQLKRCNRDAANWFYRLLINHPCADAARAYLEKRSIPLATAKRWGLGFAPDGQAIAEWGRTRGYPPDVLVQAGLVGYRDEQNPRRGVYPRFRDRLMFPICDEQGEPVAFSGRLLDPGAKTAKYLNSPETQIFDKGKLFFGFHLTKRAIIKARCAVLCEGQIDLIACYEAGIQNVLAVLGTGFTEAHGKILKRHADEVILLNDADAAGYKSSLRTFGALARAGVLVRAGEMPAGEDPDSFLQKHGAEALNLIIENAREFHDFQIEHRSAELDMSTVRGRVQLAREVALTASQLTDKAAQDALVSHAATRLRLAPEEFRKLVSEADSERRKGLRIGSHRSASSGSAPSSTAPTEFPDRAIAMLCRLALTHSDTQTFLRANANPDELRNFPGGRLLLRILEDAPDPADPAAIKGFLKTLSEPDEKGITLLMEARSPTAGALESAEQALIKLHIRSLESHIATAKASLDSPVITSSRQAELFESIKSHNKEIVDAKIRLSNSPAATHSAPSAETP